MLAPDRVGDELDAGNNAQHRYDGVVVACYPAPDAIENLLSPLASPKVDGNRNTDPERTDPCEHGQREDLQGGGGASLGDGRDKRYPEARAMARTFREPALAGERNLSVRVFSAVLGPCITYFIRQRVLRHGVTPPTGPGPQCGYGE